MSLWGLRGREDLASTHCLFPHLLRETTPLPSASPTVLGVLVMSSAGKLSELQSLGREE